MGIYRGKLTDLSRPIAGIQAVLYTQEGNKIDTDITNKWGFYQFNDVPQGPYDVYFYGGDYTDNDYITIFVAESGSNVEYYIKPTDGSVIKNSTGSLTVQIQSIINGELAVVTDGPIKLYIKNDSDEYIPLWEQEGVDANSKYEAIVPASLINGTLDIFAVAEKGYPDEFLYDSITLADLSDGVGFIGWVEPTSYVVVQDEEGNFDLSTLTVTPKFAVDGDIIDTAGANDDDTDNDKDPNFGYLSVPTSTNGVVIDPAGVVTITSDPYFKTNDSITLTWEAKYTKHDTVSKLTLTETFYKVQNGENARFVKLRLSGDRFVKPKDSSNKEPSAIKLTLQKEGLSANTVWTCDDSSINFYASATATTSITPDTDGNITGDAVWVKASEATIGTHPKITATVNEGTPWGSFVDEQTVLVQDAGSDALSVLVSNESVNFPANEDGEIPTEAYIEGITSIEVFEGAEALIYGNASTAGEYSVQAAPVNIVTGVAEASNDKLKVTYGEPSDMSEKFAHIDFTITGQRNDGSEITNLVKTQTFIRGNAGIGARSVKMTASADTFIVYNSEGASPDPSTITFTATPQNFTSPVSYKWFVGGTLQTNETGSTFAYTVPTDLASLPKLVKVQAFEGNDTDTAKSEDQISVGGSKPGSDAVTITMPNSAHTITQDPDGLGGDYNFTGSGTTLDVHLGVTPLTWDDATEPANYTYQVTSIDKTNVTIDEAEGNPSFDPEVLETATYADITGITNTTPGAAPQLVYNISVKDDEGTTRTFTATQSFSISQGGEAGEDARILTLEAETRRVVKPRTSSTKVPETVKLTAHQENFSDDVVWTVDKTDVKFYASASATDPITGDIVGNSVWVKASDMTIEEHPKITATSTFTHANGTTTAYTDTITILVQDAGSDTLSVDVSDENVTFPADKDGTVSDYSSGGTDIRVFEGSTPLTYLSNSDGTTLAAGEFKVTAEGSTTPTAITVGTASTTGTSVSSQTDIRQFDPPKDMDGESASITFTITGKKADGEDFTLTRKQTFSISKTGQTGEDAWSIELNKTSVSAVENADGTVNALNVTITPTIRQGAVDKTSEYEITATTPASDSSNGLDYTYADNTVPVTVASLNSLSEILEITYNPSTGNTGPELKASCSFTLQRSGSKGPGPLFIGDYDDLMLEKYNTGPGAPTPLEGNRPLNNNGIGRDIVSNGDLYYAYTGTDGALLNAVGEPGADTTSADTWALFESFGNVAIETLLTKESFVKTTLNVGTSAAGDSANITLFGGGVSPYLSIGQTAKGYGNNGIFLGSVQETDENGDSISTAKLSLVSDTNHFKWTGSEVDVKGKITATSGEITGKLDVGTFEIGSVSNPFFIGLNNSTYWTEYTQYKGYWLNSFTYYRDDLMRYQGSVYKLDSDSSVNDVPGLDSPWVSQGSQTLWTKNTTYTTNDNYIFNSDYSRLYNCIADHTTTDDAVSGAIYVNSNNYWFDFGAFKIGDNSKWIKWTGSEVDVKGKITATSGEITGSLTANNFEIGVNIENANTILPIHNQFWDVLIPPYSGSTGFYPSGATIQFNNKIYIANADVNTNIVHGGDPETGTEADYWDEAPQYNPDEFYFQTNIIVHYEDVYYKLVSTQTFNGKPIPAPSVNSNNWDKIFERPSVDNTIPDWTELVTYEPGDSIKWDNNGDYSNITYTCITGHFVSKSRISGLQSAQAGKNVTIDTETNSLSIFDDIGKNVLRLTNSVTLRGLGEIQYGLNMSGLISEMDNTSDTKNVIFLKNTAIRGQVSTMVGSGFQYLYNYGGNQTNGIAKFDGDYRTVVWTDRGNGKGTPFLFQSSPDMYSTPSRPSAGVDNFHITHAISTKIFNEDSENNIAVGLNVDVGINGDTYFDPPDSNARSDNTDPSLKANTTWAAFFQGNTLVTANLVIGSIADNVNTTVDYETYNSGSNLYVGGNISATGDVIAYSSSDARLKENLKAIQSPLEKLNTLGGYTFNWNEEKQKTYTGEDVGIIAQEVEKIMPWIVKDRDNGFKGVKYEKLVPLLIEAIKELNKKVEDLENGSSNERADNT